VERLFTYATPHGGIEFEVGFDLFERLRETSASRAPTSRTGAHVGLPHPGEPTPVPSEWQPQEMPDEVFPKDRIFTLIGTNPHDYDAARGLSSRAVGAKSDGLVQIENAYIPGARFAFVHRSHSGRFGIVNSEEGYQNLRRFLFGDLEVTADLVGLELPSQPNDDVVWQAEVELAVRGLPILMHQQVAAHHCPVVLELPSDAADKPQPLVTTFLIADVAARPVETQQARYTLHLKLLSLRQRRGIFDFRDHLEQTADFDDVLVVDIGADSQRLVAWAQWNSQLPVHLRDYQPSGPPLVDEDSPQHGLPTSPSPPQPEASSANAPPFASRSTTATDKEQQHSPNGRPLARRL